MSAPVVHFEIHANDRAALTQFYETVFGWKSMGMEGQPYTLLFPTGEMDPGQMPSMGIGGGMMDRQGPAPEKGQPVNGFTVVIQVDDLDATMALIHEHGGETAVEPMDIEGVGRAYYFHDPSGNIVCALQPSEA